MNKYDAIEKMFDEFTSEWSGYICNMCGNVASYNDKLHIHICKMCDNRVDYSRVHIPYSCKLLCQELMTMNIFPRIITN